MTDRAPALRAAIDELIPAAFHNTEQYANNRVECDHGRLKARLRPMRGLKRDHTAGVVMRGHAFMQNMRRGHYELGLDTRAPPARRDRVHRTRPDDLNGNQDGTSVPRGPIQLNATAPSPTSPLAIAKQLDQARGLAGWCLSRVTSASQMDGSEPGSSRRTSFPVVFRGSSSTSSTSRGTLWRARWSRTWARRSSAVGDAPGAGTT